MSSVTSTTSDFDLIARQLSIIPEEGLISQSSTFYKGAQQVIPSNYKFEPIAYNEQIRLDRVSRNRDFPIIKARYGVEHVVELASKWSEFVLRVSPTPDGIKQGKECLEKIQELGLIRGLMGVNVLGVNGEYSSKDSYDKHVELVRQMVLPFSSTGHVLKEERPIKGAVWVLHQEKEGCCVIS